MNNEYSFFLRYVLQRIFSCCATEKTHVSIFRFIPIAFQEETVPAQHEFCPASISSPPTVTTTSPSLAPVAEPPTSVSHSKSSKQPTAKASKLFKLSKGSKNDEKSKESRSKSSDSITHIAEQNESTMSVQAKYAKRIFSKVDKGNNNP